jgi:peptidoglycan/LPS O-acetylase OafA/YrhL
LLTFTQWLWPTTSVNLYVNGALWTLTIEMLLYLTLPLLAWLIAKRPVVASLTLAGIGVAYRLLCAFHGQWLQEWRFGAHSAPSEIARLYLSRQFIGILPIFVLGIALRWALLEGKLDRVVRLIVGRGGRPNFFILFAWLVPSLVYLRYVLTASSFTNWWQFGFFDYIVCLLAVPALLYAAQPISTELPRHMVPAVWMGERSYGLYLWHFPVILSIYGIGSAGNPPDLHHLPLKIVAIFVISIMLAWGSYSLVELPAREYGRKLARRVGRRTSRPVRSPTESLTLREHPERRAS